MEAVVTISVKITDAAGAVLFGTEGKPEDLSELIKKVTDELTQHVMQRLFQGLSDDIKQPLKVSWG